MGIHSWIPFSVIAMSCFDTQLDTVFIVFGYVFLVILVLMYMYAMYILIISLWDFFAGSQEELDRPGESNRRLTIRGIRPHIIIVPTAKITYLRPSRPSDPRTRH